VGQIVSVRGDILQIRPRFSSQLKRIVIDQKTAISSPQMTSVDKLPKGIFVSGIGDYTPDGGILLHFLMASDERTGFFSSNTHGIRAIGYGKSAFFGGKLKSAKPLVVTDDDGKDITPTLQGFVPVMRTVRDDPKSLQVGKVISASGERTADGLLHARSVQIEQLPNSAGAVFGEVVSIKANTLEVRPRFGIETIQAIVPDQVQMLRQVDVDPDTVKIGDTLTAQGKRLGDAQNGQTAMVAAVLLLGKQTYPQIGGGGGGFFAAIRGAGQPGLTCTGKVASFSPFVLTQEDGKQVTVTIPGQTPIVDLRPVTLSEIKPGDKLMVDGAEGKTGSMVVKLLILGASPIVGLGD
jgi:hypothetical protein